jgi:hypothetical protein
MARRSRLTPSIRLRRLLEAGYFPPELPPPFVTHSFARYRAALERNWNALPSKKGQPSQYEQFRSRPEPFSLPRSANARRRTVIVNPINHFRLSRLLAFEWRPLRDHIATSEISEFRPIFDQHGPRSIFDLDWQLVDRRTLEILADYNRAFKTDITRFYASIYTHSIAWALLGKDHVKRNRFTSAFKSSLGNRLDIEVRKGQEDQSIGLPIGPDTSRILSEVIGVGLERELASQLGGLARRTVRYVDDMIIGFDDNESEEAIAAALEAAMSHYELDINVSKTRILGVDDRDAPHWISELRACSVRPLGARQRDDLERFFRLALSFASGAESDAVLKWTAKRARSFRVSDENFPLLCDNLLRVARKSAACFPTISQAFIEANRTGRPLPRIRIEKFIRDTIRVHAPVGHSFEVAWGLFLAKGLRIRLERSELEAVFKLDCSVCALICMDLNVRGLISGGIDESSWRGCANEAGLSSSMWLLSYEAARKRWWQHGVHAYAQHHPLFGPMIRHGVSFYDINRNVPTLKRELQSAKRQSAVTHFLMTHWDAYF